jgi:hypothetical protein
MQTLKMQAGHMYYFFLKLLILNMKFTYQIQKCFSRLVNFVFKTCVGCRYIRRDNHLSNCSIICIIVAQYTQMYLKNRTALAEDNSEHSNSLNHTCLANAKQRLGKQPLLGKNQVAVNQALANHRLRTSRC